MKLKLYILVVSTIIFNSSYVFSMCGGCDHNNKVKTKEVLKANTVVMSIPENKTINGIVLASCGKCHFGTKDRRCSLSIKIGEQILPVRGTTINDYGDMHAHEGFCTGVRAAWVKGSIKKNVFYSESFELVTYRK